ncbi:MAG: DUF362 domain-containing protein [Caldilineae bacterium]|nr:MAG: DUF362 domain-containing protein [Caldilineae bacterium]
MSQKPYAVRAVHCDHRADDETVYQALKRATDPLDRAWERLRRANTIAIKFNQDKAPRNVVMFDDRNRQQLVSDSVVRATLRLLRERTNAELVCVDVSFYTMYNGESIADTCQIRPLLEEFGVRYADGTQPPYTWVDTPGGGQMFRRYQIMQACADADELISVALIKNHAFMGVTGCLKNLFGLMPGEFHGGRPRHYYHHLVRMPYHLADLGRLFDPALNIVDALVGQAGQEWGDGVDKYTGQPQGRVVNGLMAGDHVIATDACLMHLMGHDPQADWPTPPFHRDRNAVKVAAEGGNGTVDLDAIDFQSELAPQPPGVFYAIQTDAPAITYSWLQTMCEQALLYRDNRQRFVDQYAGEYILLQQGEVRWHSPEGTIRQSRRKLAGQNPEQAMWFKYVDPEEDEGEHFEVYEQTLQRIKDKAPVLVG